MGRHVIFQILAVAGLKDKNVFQITKLYRFGLALI